jgi:hypothetical protein
MFSNLNRLQILILVIIIVAAIFTGVLAFANAKKSAADKQTAADISKITEALKIYQEVNGFYPAGTSGMPAEMVGSYLDFYPTPKTNQCNGSSQYKYEQLRGGEDYALNIFCS